MLTLYDFAPSPHCVRVRVALALAALPYRKVRMKLNGDQRRLSFRAVSPFGTVPVLVDGSTPIAQSYAALLWLGDRHTALLPRARARRARVLSWVAAAATELDPIVGRAYAEAYFVHKPDPRRRTIALRELGAALDRVERARAGEPRGRYVVGNAPTIADAALLPALWLVADLAGDFPRSLALGRWPTLRDWYARMIGRSDVERVLAEADA